MKTNGSALYWVLSGVCCSLLGNTEMQNTSSLCCDFFIFYFGILNLPYHCVVVVSCLKWWVLQLQGFHTFSPFSFSLFHTQLKVVCFNHFYLFIYFCMISSKSDPWGLRSVRDEKADGPGLENIYHRAPRAYTIHTGYTQTYIRSRHTLKTSPVFFCCQSQHLILPNQSFTLHCLIVPLWGSSATFEAHL